MTAVLGKYKLSPVEAKHWVRDKMKNNVAIRIDFLTGITSLQYFHATYN
jgi:hypothetical protein